MPMLRKSVVCREVAKGDSSPASELFLKTKMCKFFVQGRCARGSSCKFAHGEGDMTSLPDFSKTEMCIAFLRTGACANGERCRFAHHEVELRPRLQTRPVRTAAPAPPTPVAPRRESAMAADATTWSLNIGCKPVAARQLLREEQEQFQLDDIQEQVQQLQRVELRRQQTMQQHRELQNLLQDCNNNICPEQAAQLNEVAENLQRVAAVIQALQHLVPAPELGHPSVRKLGPPSVRTSWADASDRSAPHTPYDGDESPFASEGSAWSRQTTDDHDSQECIFGRQDTEDSQVSWNGEELDSSDSGVDEVDQACRWKVEVKNSFLTVVEDDSVDKPLRRSKSLSSLPW